MRWLIGFGMLVCAASSARADDSRCERGKQAARSGDHVRAYLLLSDCGDEAATAARKAAKKSLEAGDFAPVLVTIKPDSASVTVTPLGESFVSTHTVWLPFGKHVFEASAEGYESFSTELEITDRSRLSLPLRLRKQRTAAGGSSVDFGESDEGQPVGGLVTVKDPKPQKHESLLRDKFKNAPDPVLEAADEPPNHALWGGIALGAGVAVGGAGGALVGFGGDSATIGGASMIGVGVALAVYGIYRLSK